MKRGERPRERVERSEKSSGKDRSRRRGGEEEWRRRDGESKLMT